MLYFKSIAEWMNTSLPKYLNHQKFGSLHFLGYSLDFIILTLHLNVSKYCKGVWTCWHNYIIRITSYLRWVACELEWHGNITIFLGKDRLLSIYQKYSIWFQSGGAYAQMNDSFGPYYCDYFWEMIQFIIIFSITCFHFFCRDKLDFGSLILFQIMVSIFGFTPCGFYWFLW